MRERKRILVLAGGSTRERDVSLSMGRSTFEALERLGHTAVFREVHSETAALSAAFNVRPDLVFNSLLGAWAEDGRLQRSLSERRVPYTHAGPIALAMGIDKLYCRKLADKMFGRAVSVELISQPLDGPGLPYPVVVKPRYDGSSFGVHFVASDDDWQPEAFVGMMAESYVPGLELSCGVVGEQTTEVVEIELPAGAPIFDTTAKYDPAATRHVIPARLPEAIKAEVQRQTLGMHQALKCGPVSRSDFRYDPIAGCLAYIETNVLPAMTRHSLLPELALGLGYAYDDLVAFLVAGACPRTRQDVSF